MQTAPLRSERPFPLPADLDTSRALSRAGYASFVARGKRTSPEAECERLYPRDAAALAVTRASISGATTTDPVWAGGFYERVTTAFFTSLAPQSAAAGLIARGTTVQLTEGPLAVPVLTSAIAAAPWVQETGAIPVDAFTFGAVHLTPKKMALIVVMSREVSQNSNAGDVFDRLLRSVGAYSLDAAYFSDDDGSVAGHHAGLLAGLVAGTGTADMMADLGALAAAVSGPGASGQVVFVMPPGRAATAALPTTLNATILVSPALPADRVIAVDPAALLHGFGANVDILTSPEALVHMEDTTPLNIATGPQGSGVLATPTQSMFQIAAAATRLLVDVAFAKTRVGCVAYLDGADW